jgi:E3 ubiquitin-protein ligase FANCL
MNEVSNNGAILIATEPCFKCVIFTNDGSSGTPSDGASTSLLSVAAPSMIAAAASAMLQVPEDNKRIGKEMIQSLSFVNVSKLAPRLRHSLDMTWMQELNWTDYQVSIFSQETLEGRPRKRNRRALQIVMEEDEDKKSANESDTHEKERTQINMDEDTLQRMELISQMNPKGLEQRLMDAFDSVKLKSTTNATNSTSTRTSHAKKLQPYQQSLLFLKRAEAIVQELMSAMVQEQRRRRQVNMQNRSITKDQGPKEGSQRSIRHFQALLGELPSVETLLDVLRGDLLDINHSLTQLKITYHDEANRDHLLICNLHLHKFPLVGPTWTCDLPCEFNPCWTSASSSLSMHHMQDTANGATKQTNKTNGSGSGLLYSCIHQFISLVTKYQPLWNELDDLDAHAWVLEPSLPSLRSCVERRIALRPGLSTHFILDPEDVRSIPLSLRLVGGGGSGESAFDLRKRYRAYISHEGGGPIHPKDKDMYPQETDKNVWSYEKSVRSNIETCFGFPLPSPDTTDKADFIAECGICYTHHLPLEEEHNKEGRNQGQGTKEAFMVPNVLCGNPKCGRSYHETCLFEWLHSLLLPDIYRHVHTSTVYSPQ